MQDVTVTLTVSDPGQVTIEVDEIKTDTIVFTPSDYYQLRTVTVTAVDDDFSESTHYVIISHKCTSDDTEYNNIIIPDVPVRITDNDGNRRKVFLIGGQSNAAGSGLNAEYPESYQSPQNDVEFWVGGRIEGDGAGDWDSGPPVWTPDEGFDGVRYHIFKESAVKPALQEIIDRGDIYEIAGMFWMQGETDAGNLTAADNYEYNLNKLIHAVRTDLSAPDMKFVIGRIRTVMGTYNTAVRAAIENVAIEDFLTKWINTDDLAVNADNVHYSAAGLVEMGQRFANAYLNMLPERGDFEPDGDIDLIDFAQFAAEWLDTDCGFCRQADFNSDMDKDLVILIESWMGN